MTNIKLIIFDFDGVLVDSEYIAAQVTTRLLSEYGVKTNLQTTLQKFVGQHVDTIARYLEQDIGKHNVEDFKMKSKVENRKAFIDKLTPLPFVVDTLSKIEIPMCVGSNSAYDSLIAKLEISKLDKFFSPEALFVSSMVKKPKPAPDIFLHAAKYYGVVPSECLVIEDSVHGIQAALEANMQVIGYFGASHCGHEYRQLLINAGAFLTFNDMRYLDNILTSL